MTSAKSSSSSLRISSHSERFPPLFLCYSCSPFFSFPSLRHAHNLSSKRVVFSWLLHVTIRSGCSLLSRSLARCVHDEAPDGGAVHLGVHSGVAGCPTPDAEAGDPDLPVVARGLPNIGPPLSPWQVSLPVWPAATMRSATKEFP